MIKLITFISVGCLFINVSPEKIHTVILGGDDAPDNAIPYQASLRTLQNSNFCGGTILNNRWVLTAAHCTKGRSHLDVKVVVGTNNLLSGGDSYSVESIINHENFTNAYSGNDISLIKVSSDIAFGDRVQPILLPEENTGAGVSLTTSGWGRINMEGDRPTVLQMIVLTALSVEQCQKEFDGRQTILDSQICTLTKPGEGTCKGDSGGPLVDDKSVVGIISWGIPCAIGLPDIFTRVYAFKDWIKKKIAP